MQRPIRNLLCLWLSERCRTPLKRPWSQCVLLSDSSVWTLSFMEFFQERGGSCRTYFVSGSELLTMLQMKASLTSSSSPSSVPPADLEWWECVRDRQPWKPPWFFRPTPNRAGQSAAPAPQTPSADWFRPLGSVRKWILCFQARRLERLWREEEGSGSLERWEVGGWM